MATMGATVVVGITVVFMVQAPVGKVGTGDRWYFLQATPAPHDAQGIFRRAEDADG